MRVHQITMMSVADKKGLFAALVADEDRILANHLSLVGSTQGAVLHARTEFCNKRGLTRQNLETIIQQGIAHQWYPLTAPSPEEVWRMRSVR